MAKKKTPDLGPIEEAYGFVFGDPTGEARTAHADPTVTQVGSVICMNPNCPDHSHVAIYSDTTLPVHCGTCYTPLVQDPNAAPDLSLLDAGTPLHEAVYDRVLERLRAEGHIQ
jgi:hypothetical protein